MKKYILQLFAAVCVMMAFCACNPAESKIDELENLVAEVEAEYKEYTEEDWQGINEAYEALLLDMEQYDYNTEQHKRIGRLKGKYEAIVLKYTMSNFSTIMEDYAEDMGKYAGDMIEGVEGFIEGMAEELEDVDGADYNFCCDSTDI